MAKSIDLNREPSRAPTALGRQLIQRLRSHEVLLGARFFEGIDELSLIAKAAVEMVNAYRIAIQTVHAVKEHFKT